MLEYREWATGVGQDADRPPRLLEFGAVDLRTLRFMDDPELVAAVERVLCRPSDLVEAWVEGAGDGRQ